jgi:hypothetical protein
MATCNFGPLMNLAEMGDEFPGAKEELAHFFRPARDAENEVKQRIGTWHDKDVLHRDEDYRGPIKWPRIMLGKPLAKSSILSCLEGNLEVARQLLSASLTPNS